MRPRRDIVVIGAGLTGLAAAYFLPGRCRIVERLQTAGGLCASTVIDGFTFDHSGHFLHMADPEMRALMHRLMGRGLAVVERSAWIYQFNRFIPYPFQSHLDRLPARVRRDCERGLLAAARAHAAPDPQGSFEQWSRAAFGAGITRHFMKPYNEKLWTVPVRRLTADWTGGFVPSAGRATGRPAGYNARFWYPRRGGSQAIIDTFVREGAGDITFGAEVVKIDAGRRRVVTGSGDVQSYRALITTMPLPELVSRLVAPPSEVRAAAQVLDWNSVAVVNIGARRRAATRARSAGRHWTYFPQAGFRFYRAGIYSNIMPSSAPRDHDGFYVEFSARPEVRASEEQLITAAVDGLRRCGLLRHAGDIVTTQVVRIPCAYAVYDPRRASARAVILDWCARRGIYSIGRYGGWEYSFMERSILNARETARRITGECP